MTKIEFSIKSGFNHMDFDKITFMLKDAYWSIGIKKAEVIQGAEHSTLLTGAFTADNIQIGYARVISDKTRFAYIMDVIVEEQYRKLGIGQAMVNSILNHPELKSVYSWLLATKDAHGLYQKLGFKTLSTPENWMEIRYDRPQR